MSQDRPTPSAPTLLPVPALLLAILSGKTGAALAKGLFASVGPTGAATLRVGFAALLLLGLLRPPLHRFTRAQWAAVVPYGVVLGTMNACFYLAIARIPLGLGITLQFLGPLGLALASSRRAAEVLWALLAAAGVGLLVPWRGGAGALDPWGVGLALVAGAGWAGYIVLGRRVAQRLPHGWGVGVGMACASLTLLPFTGPALAAAPPPPAVLATGLAVGVLSSALPYTLEMRALRALPNHVFGVLVSLEPAVAALLGLLLLGERLTPTQWAAVACVSAASAGATLLRSRPPPSDAQSAAAAS
jgi:inner membrane transporter RhtA